MENKTIGFIGTGYMGSIIVKKLLEAGYTVHIYNRTKEKTTPLVQKGAIFQESVAELAEQSDIIMSSLFNDEVIESVYLDRDGVIEHLKPDSLIIELSSVRPETSRKIASRAKERGSAMLDAAISGSTPVLEKGEVILLVGGNKQDYEKIQELFSLFSKASFYMGESGKGEAMKLVINTLLGIEMAGIAEAVRLGEALGLGREHILEVLGNAAVMPAALKGKLENLKKESYPTQFKAKLMRKDLDNVLDEEHANNLQLKVAEAADEEFASIQEEYGDKDFSAVFTTIK